MDLFFAGGRDGGIDMDLYYAGEYQFKINASMYLDAYLLGYNRLLSYGYQQSLVDKLIQQVKDMDLFFAGSDKLGEEERRRVLDLYLVGPEKEEVMKVATEETPSNILFSYLTAKAVDKYKDTVAERGKLFIDSGAFSAWTQGKQINVDEYISWINERSDFIDLYGQIDVIPGDRNSGALPSLQEVREAAQKTWENYLYMRPKMKKPEGLLYTFHVGEPAEFLKRALEWRDENGNLIPYIALGGMVGKNARVRENFLDMCFDVIRNSPNPNVKVHAFGMTDKNLLSRYPIESADSTSWIMVGANGNIMTDVGTVTVSTQQSNLPTHYSHLPKDAVQQFEKNILEFGFTLDELAESRDKRIMHNARYMKKRFADIKYTPKPKKKKLF